MPDEAEPIKGPFQFQYKWWDKNRPKLLPSTGLGKALAAYEKAKDTLRKAIFFRWYREARKALQDADTARAGAAKKCGSTFKKTKTSLENSSAALKAEKKALQDLMAPGIEKELEKWSPEVDKLFERLANTTKSYEDLLDKIRAKDDAAIQTAMKIIKSDKASSFSVSISPAAGTTLDEMRKFRKIFEPDFPEQYRTYDEISNRSEGLGAMLNGVNRLKDEMVGAIKARGVDIGYL